MSAKLSAAALAVFGLAIFPLGNAHADQITITTNYGFTLPAGTLTPFGGPSPTAPRRSRGPSATPQSREMAVPPVTERAIVTSALP